MNLTQTILRPQRVISILLAALCPIGASGCLGGEPASNPQQPDIVTPKADGEPTRKVDSPVVDAPRGSDRVLADVSGVKVTESEVMPRLYQAYGLQFLLLIAQRDMAKAEAARDSITVSQADIDRERRVNQELMFPEQDPSDYPALLTQYLAQQHVTSAEFEIAMETGAYLRALVHARAEQGINEEMIRAEFNSIYGERVRVRHIALSNLQEVAEARKRLAGDPTATPPVPPEPFEQVARQMSKYASTARVGGALPPFARTSNTVPATFAAAAFGLNVGQVSDDAIKDGDFYHIIKLEERLPPRAVTFESVRDSVRQRLLARREQALMAERRAEMAERARRDMVILEPQMKQQFEDRLKAANPNVPTSRDKTNERLDEIRARLNLPTSTQPTTEPATTAPAGAP